MQEAKANFSKLIAAVEAGEEVTLERYGKAVARLVPFEKTGEGPLTQARNSTDDT